MSTRRKVIPLSPIDWMMPRSYITQILCFSSSSSQFPQILRDGLAGTLANVPYLTYKVIEGNSPKGSVVLSETDQSLDDVFEIKDLCATTDYESLKSAEFSPSSLDGRDILHTNLNASSVSYSGPLSVFRATLSVVRNGYLLCISVHHSTTDITGFGALLKIWASHCKTGASRPVQFSDVWLEREKLSHMAIDASVCCPALLHVRKKFQPIGNSTSTESDGLDSTIFHIQKTKLQNLKDEIINHLPHDLTWVSTGDILTTVLWSAITFAELQDNAKSGWKFTISENEERSIRIPVNFRHRYHPPLSKDYLGAAFGVSLASARVIDLRHIATGVDRDISISALAKVAAAVRRAINLVDGENMRRVVQYLAAQTDLRDFQLAPDNNSPSIVSWADEGIYDLDWGCKIGHCDAVRLPSLKNKRWPIILPRHRNGDLEVFVRLRRSQIDILENTWVMRLVQAKPLESS